MKKSVDAFYGVTESLGKAAEFVGTGLIPVFFVVGIADEVAIFHLLSSNVKGDSIGIVFESTEWV